MLSKLFDRMLDRIALNFAARVSRCSAPVNVDDEGRVATRVGRRIDEDLSRRVREISKTRG